MTKSCSICHKEFDESRLHDIEGQFICFDCRQIQLDQEMVDVKKELNLLDEEQKLTEEEFKKRAKSVGGGLMGVAMFGMLFSGAIAASNFMDILKGLGDQELAWGLVLSFGSSALINSFIMYGGFMLSNGKQYKAALIASVLSLIPCISSLVCVGIIFGIVSLLFLIAPGVKDQFQ